MERKFRLLKDYSTPYCFLPKGSISTEYLITNVNGMILFGTILPEDNHYSVSLDFILQHKDWFEEVLPKTYTEKELLEAEEKAFNAGKELGDLRQFPDPFIKNSWHFTRERYVDFSEYKNKTSK